MEYFEMKQTLHEIVETANNALKWDYICKDVKKAILYVECCIIYANRLLPSLKKMETKSE